MKTKLLLAAAAAFVSLGISATAEDRTFTSTDGKKIEGELVGVAAGAAEIKMKGGRSVKVPFARFSSEDQEFIKEWAAENKTIPNGAIKLDLKRDGKIVRPSDEVEKENKKKGISEKKQTFSWKGTLNNNTREPIEEVKLAYTIYKRVTEEGITTPDSKTRGVNEETGEEDIGELEAGAKHEIATKEVDVRNMTERVKGSKTEKAFTKEIDEDLLGIKVIVTVKDKEVLTFTDPSNLEDKLAQETKDKEKL